MKCGRAAPRRCRRHRSVGEQRPRTEEIRAHGSAPLSDGDPRACSMYRETRRDGDVDGRDVLVDCTCRRRFVRVQFRSVAPALEVSASFDEFAIVGVNAYARKGSRDTSRPFVAASRCRLKRSAPTALPFSRDRVTPSHLAVHEDMRRSGMTRPPTCSGRHRRGGRADPDELTVRVGLPGQRAAREHAVRPRPAAACPTASSRACSGTNRI